MPRVKDTGYVNPQEVYNYLVNVKGLSREHALGMLSNIQAESGFKIAVQEYGKPQGTGGVGLFQHTGPRRQALVKYTGGDVNDWTKQVDFALQEGVTKTYLSQKFETPEEASIWFTTKWERPANANQRAQERLKYLNNYSNFSGYESTYQPSSSSSSQGTGQNAQQGAAQMPIPFKVVIAGKPQQVAFSYEDFQKALATTQKEEEKEQESEARQELKQEMTTQEAFLKAMESISLPSASSQGNQQQQFAAADTTGYEPLPIQEVSTSLPQLPNIFSTKLPEMQEGGPLVIGETYYYPGRPGSSYQINDNGQWTIKNSSTAGKYVPIKDPTGQRAETLERYALDSGAYQEYINKAKKQVSNPTSTLKINDPRTIRATTNQAIRPNVDLMSGTYNKEVITNIVSRAKTLGIDPATALAVAYQESQFGKTDPNLGHMSEAFEGSQDPYMYLNVLKNKMQSAQKAGYNDELYQLQYYNGMGKLFPGTESSYHGYQAGKFYGVPVPASGLDLSKNPLYGKQIIDLRDNVLLKNPEVVNIIKNTPTGKGFREGGKKVSPQDTKEMLDGIADILRQVVNVNNRKAIAKNMIGDFNREGLDYDLNNFLRSSKVKMLEGGPVKPPTFNLSYNPYVYNPNELTGYRGYGDLSGTSLGVSTPDLLGREKKINALKVPFSASVNRLYDPNVQNTTIDYSDPQNLNQGMTAEQLQTGAQQQLDSASQPYLDKNPLGFNIQTGVSGSGLNSNVKRRTKIDASVGVGYNPLSGFNAGASGKFSFALGNDFYRPLKNTGDWRAVGNIQPFGMSVNQLSAYNEQQDMIQSNLQQVASTGAYSDLTQNVNNYDNTKPGVASGVQFTFGAGVDGSVKLPIGMLNAGAGLKYNRAAGEAERLSPTAYVGYSVSGAELSRLGNKLPNINLPDSRRSNYETLANQDLETEKGEWVQGPDGQFTWRDFPGFNGAFNASTFEGEDIYVPTVLPNKQNGGAVKTFALF